MSKLLIPNVNDKFESLKAFENTARSAAKYEGMENIAEETQKRKRNTRRDSCYVYIRSVATKFYSTASGLKTEVKWVVTKAVFEHNHSILELDVSSIPYREPKSEKSSTTTA
ncbi:hypothetical protein C2G38_2232736 [Gigaspora rosea]|uniref:FAR1 domain-containing protein n=1 Tax=Gigaspora rosea TaxID=44941 RepID=A0A397TRQ1_9GLOM|nr:hypothetical protein C2G38_2232736 [Gigaspora rosea]